MSNCGEISVLSGGMIDSSTVNRSDITNSNVTGGVVSGAAIENIASIDSSSVQKIVEAIKGLDDATRKSLGEALGFTVETGKAPAETEGTALPTTVAGSRDYLLGKPTEWAVIAGKNVPVY